MEDVKYTRPDPVELTAEELTAVSGGCGCGCGGPLVNVSDNTIQANVNVLGIAYQTNHA
jgi:hypothetical protein